MNEEPICELCGNVFQSKKKLKYFKGVGLVCNQCHEMLKSGVIVVTLLPSLEHLNGRTGYFFGYDPEEIAIKRREFIDKNGFGPDGMVFVMPEATLFGLEIKRVVLSNTSVFIENEFNEMVMDDGSLRRRT